MKLGILGGIGPEASSYFYDEIIRRLRDSGSIHDNADYPQIIINSINAPELTTLELTDEMLASYVKGIRELETLKPDYIVMACNTIHLFRNRLIEQSGYKNISDMRQIVSKALERVPGKICILATPSTVVSGLYSIAGREYLNPTQTELQQIGDVVVSYNATGEIEKNRAILVQIANAHKTEGASVFVAGCTEVSELLRGETNLNIVDTLELLIEDTLTRIRARLVGERATG